MLNFSKIKILLIYFLFSIITFFTLLNFQNKENIFIDKKVNLGLDLQGGSYLLLEIDTDPLVKQKIQDKVIPLKKLLRDNNLKYSNFNVNDKKIILNIEKKKF